MPRMEPVANLEGMKTRQELAVPFAGDILVPDVLPVYLSGEQAGSLRESVSSRPRIRDASTELLSPKSIGFSSSHTSDLFDPAAILGHHRSIIIEQGLCNETGVTSQTSSPRHMLEEFPKEVMSGNQEGSAQEEDGEDGTDVEEHEPDLIVEPPFGNYTIRRRASLASDAERQQPDIAEAEISTLANSLFNGANLLDRCLTPIQTFKSCNVPRGDHPCFRDRVYGSLSSSGQTASLTDDQSEDSTTPASFSESPRPVGTFQEFDAMKPLDVLTFSTTNEYLKAGFSDSQSSSTSTCLTFCRPRLERSRTSLSPTYTTILSSRSGKRKHSDASASELFATSCKAARNCLDRRVFTRPDMAVVEMPELSLLQRTLPAYTRRIRSARLTTSAGRTN